MDAARVVAAGTIRGGVRVSSVGCGCAMVSRIRDQ